MTAFETRLLHPSFQHPSNRDATVWRYMSLSKLISLLYTSKLQLSSLEMLNDPHEGAVTRMMHLQRQQAFEEVGMDYNQRATIASVGISLKKVCYVSCWALDQHESEALWRLYAGNSEGVAIKSTYNELINIMRNDSHMYVGQIQYLDYDQEVFPGGNLFYPVMHKRKAFGHEHEVRLVRLDMRDLQPPPTIPPTFELQVNLEGLVKNIHINPYAASWYVDVVKAVVEKFCNSLSDRVIWSSLRAEPLY